jgi:hypothetical protein
MIRGEEPIEPLIERIRSAHNLVKRATQIWNAGSLAAVQECVVTLEQSVAELRAATAAAAGHPDSLGDLRNEILEMKKSTARLERLSDLATAFLRGGESAADSPLYRPGGFEETGDSSWMSTTKVHA